MQNLLPKDLLPLQRQFTPYLFLLPALLVLGLTVFWPALQAFYLSFTRYDLSQSPEWIGLANFQRLWKDREYAVIPRRRCTDFGDRTLGNRNFS